MQILVAAATALEITPFLKSHPQADVLITGVGLPAAVYQLAKRLHQVDYDLVIQAGIGGSFSADHELGKTVLVSRDRFADIGVSEKGGFKSLFNMGLADADAAPFSGGWLVNEDPLLATLEYDKVRAVTVNTITDDSSVISQFVKQYNPVIESMEGAALHYVALLEHTRFIQLRAISNVVGERNKQNWKMKEAIENLNAALEKIYATVLHG